jgi:hypothetical protein
MDYYQLSAGQIHSGEYLIELKEVAPSLPMSFLSQAIFESLARISDGLMNELPTFVKIFRVIIILQEPLLLENMGAMSSL